MYIRTVWQELWNNITRNKLYEKLYEILPDLKQSLCGTARELCREQDSVMTRLESVTHG